MTKLFKSVGITAGLAIASGALGGGSHEGGHGHADSHRHDSWVQPPAEYARKVWDKWDDRRIGARGKQLYLQQCASCHGEDGRGNGPAGAALPHKPADLTNHFHLAPGRGDGYLFWRISEGGQVPPFNAMQSAMPSFKHLSEDDRWAILTYVHQRFHGGFPKPHMQEAMHGGKDHHQH